MARKVVIEGYLNFSPDGILRVFQENCTGQITGSLETVVEHLERVFCLYDEQDLPMISSVREGKFSMLPIRITAEEIEPVYITYTKEEDG